MFIIKLKEMNFSFSKIFGKLKINKISEHLRNFENKEKKERKKTALYSTQ